MPPEEARIEEGVEESTPDTAPETSETETSEGSWDSLADSFEEAEAEEFEPEVTEETGEEDPAPAPEPEPPAPVEEEPAPQEVKEEPVAQTPPPQPEPTPQPQAQPGQAEEERRIAAEQWQQARGQWSDRLAQQYNLSPEWAEKVESSPAEALPQLAAEIHMTVYEELSRTFSQHLPAALEQHLARREAQTTKESTFFSRWPELQSHRGQVEQIAHMWRQMNPQASEQEAYESIGNLAMAALGLTPAEAGAAASQKQAVPPADVTSSVPPVSSASRRGPTNPYEALDAAWDTEDFD